ncbi:multidrug resistance-associated protein 5, partial [Tanacetum coccineum]
PNQGEILTTIRRDGNNHIYPVAWAVVNIENKDNRTWFLELLKEDLGCSKGNGLTLMSDQHKGLIEAVKDIMDKIKSANPNAHKYLMDKNPKTWSRAFFEVDRDCEEIENGFSEWFNSMIVNVRHKPLLTMLDAIRVIVLERMNKMRKISRKWNPRVCPNIKKRLKWVKFWHVIPTGGNLFEVRSESEGFTTDEGKRTCSCRMWQLSGLPCVHATKRGPVRDEGASGTRGGYIWSRGRGGTAGSRGGASGSIGRGAGGSGSASRSRGRGVGGSSGRGAGGSKRKLVSTAGTQKRQGKKKVGTFGFAKWFGLQDEPEQTQAEPQQSQHEPEQTQVKDQVEQTED